MTISMLSIVREPEERGRFSTGSLFTGVLGGGDDATEAAAGVRLVLASLVCDNDLSRLGARAGSSPLGGAAKSAAAASPETPAPRYSRIWSAWRARSSRVRPMVFRS
jgi:hypothetical protein